MSRSKIEWLARPGTVPESWNPVTGCNVDGKRIKVSPGCDNCWAERMARRLAGRVGYPEQPHHFDVTLHEDRLDVPLHWRKPRTVFVTSMGDLFHAQVPADYIKMVLSIIRKASDHTFLMLTKRARRMLELTNWLTDREGWPENVWLGVSVEDQQTANERIPILLQIPAAVRFVNYGPALGPVDLSEWLRERGDGYFPIGLPRRQPALPANWHQPRLDWIVAEGESGFHARPSHPDWFKKVRDDCQEAGIPFHFKQWGEWVPYDQKNGTEIPKKMVTGCWLDVRGHASPNYSAMLHEPSALFRVGKKAAGRLLDGREWNEWPG